MYIDFMQLMVDQCKIEEGFSFLEYIRGGYINTHSL